MFSPLKSLLLPVAIIAYSFSCLALVIYLSITPIAPRQVAIERMPDFAAIRNTREKKAAFFSYLRPAIDQQNQLLRALRGRLLSLQSQLDQGGRLSSSQVAFLNRQSKRFGVNGSADTPEQQLALLLHRADEIPSSLVLAQAAMESAWGTSRFARQANNLFGQWCFSRGCGIVPKHRSPGARHEVKKFDSVDEAIRAYFHNINTHNAYQQLRDIRAKSRHQGNPLRGFDLVAGLEKYSARGQAYIEELRSMIRSNRLE